MQFSKTRMSERVALAETLPARAFANTRRNRTYDDDDGSSNDVVIIGESRSRFHESSQQRYANLPTET